MTKLTNKQQVVLEYIQRYLCEHREGPYIREIQAGCQIASYKSTVDRLNALERKGFIRRTPNRHRGIRLRNHVTPPPVPAAVPNGNEGSGPASSSVQVCVQEEQAG